MNLVRNIITAIISIDHGHSFAFVMRSTAISLATCDFYKSSEKNFNSSRVRMFATDPTPKKMMAMIDPNDAEDEDRFDVNTIDGNDASRFLEKLIFDPEAPSNENSWFANLMTNDYYTAEALYAGVIVIIGVIIAQDMLRIVKYGGGHYDPFSSIGPG